MLAGFLAGSGWLLVAGGVAMVTGSSISNILPALMDGNSLTLLLPAAVVALLLWYFTHSFSHPLTIVSTLLATFLVFHGMLLAPGRRSPKRSPRDGCPRRPTSAPWHCRFPTCWRL